MLGLCVASNALLGPVMLQRPLDQVGISGTPVLMRTLGYTIVLAIIHDHRSHIIPPILPSCLVADDMGDKCSLVEAFCKLLLEVEISHHWKSK